MTKLRIVFDIKNTEDGLVATMDSPDQGATGIPVTAVKRSGASLTLELKQFDGAFEDTINRDLTQVEGTWTQGGISQPFTLRRVKNAAELERRRPQNPVNRIRIANKKSYSRTRQQGSSWRVRSRCPRARGGYLQQS